MNHIDELLYKFPPAIDYHLLEAHIEKKHDVCLDDFAGRFSTKTRQIRENVFDEWLKKNGFYDKKYVLFNV